MLSLSALDNIAFLKFSNLVDIYEVLIRSIELEVGL